MRAVLISKARTHRSFLICGNYKYCTYYQELMRRKERPTTQYSAAQYLHLNGSNTFLIRSDAQVGNFPVRLLALLYV